MVAKSTIPILSLRLALFADATKPSFLPVTDIINDGCYARNSVRRELFGPQENQVNSSVRQFKSSLSEMYLLTPT